MILPCGVLKVMDYFKSGCIIRQQPMILQCGVLNVMDCFHCVMHNSPAAEDFAMWSVKCYGLFSLCDV